MTGDAVAPARLVHCDWSVHPRKRWRADAERVDGGWRVHDPRPVGSLPLFVADLVSCGSTLAGFDLPIGLVEAFGAETGLPGFRALLPRLGTPGPWAEFFDVNARPDTITRQRPFYPARMDHPVAATALTERLGVPTFDELRRACERPQAGRRAASPMFWTVGAAQVGKAAICGWRDVLQPALAGGALLWPFDGPLDRLCATQRLTLCETYPADAYHHVGIVFASGMSKRRRQDRQVAMRGLAARMADHIRFVPACRDAIADGFGDDPAGEDRFDALAGLLGMIEMVDGRRAPIPPAAPAVPWEGWILGRGPATGMQ